MIKWLTFSLLFLTVNPAQAYPEFIAYGYSACITCHFDGLGGGPLNDYGRALWSAEIAARPFYASANDDDEALGNQSGFLGTTKLPYWLKPHAKYRGLEYETGPGSTNVVNTYLTMQADVGVTLQADENGKYLASATWGHVVTPQGFGLGQQGLDHFLATEYYLRAEVVETWFVYIGLLEKVFGIRTPDHESFQRQYQGFQIYGDTIDGQAFSHGAILHKVADHWEAALNVFGGNPHDDPAYQQKGGSIMAEADVGDKRRVGAAVMTEQSQIKSKNLAEVHYKSALTKASSFLGEYGLIADQLAGASSMTGGYNYLELMFNMTRGYNLVSALERYNQMFNPAVPDQWKWRVGLLAWPMPRLEFRMDAVTTRNLTNTSAGADVWYLEGQVHVSL